MVSVFGIFTVLLCFFWGIASLKGIPIVIEFPVVNKWIATIMLTVPIMWGYSSIRDSINWIRSQIRRNRTDD